MDIIMNNWWSEEMRFFSVILNDLFDGSQKSDCLLPCTTTHFETKFLNKYASDTSYIDVTFSSEVREAYPKPILLTVALNIV